jgi:hypothetical protein
MYRHPLPPEKRGIDTRCRPLPKHVHEVVEMAASVDEHLRKMRFQP